MPPCSSNRGDVSTPSIGPLLLVIYDIQRQRGVYVRPHNTRKPSIFGGTQVKRESQSSQSFSLSCRKYIIYLGWWQEASLLPQINQSTASQPIFISCRIDIEVSSIRHLIPFLRSSHPSSYHLKLVFPADMICSSLTLNHHPDYRVLLFKKMRGTTHLERHMPWTYNDIHLAIVIICFSLRRSTYFIDNTCLHRL